MKVGLSLSRCLRDIVEGNVLFEDVLVVIARTDVDPDNDEHWKAIFDGYLYGGLSHPEWQGMEDEEENLRHVLRQLHKHGKLHQPRQFGAHPPRMRYYWLECVVPENEHNPAQQKAWDNYKLITDLA
jgi:cytochrome oxidase Cu insertion factor (SCO1/SenC/PrrC family)